MPWFVSSPWFPLVVIVVLLEVAVLFYLAIKLESISMASSSAHHHRHQNKNKIKIHSPWTVNSLRRTILRWSSPEWRQKSHNHQMIDIDSSAGSNLQPAFHHFQFSYAKNGRYLLPPRIKGKGNSKSTTANPTVLPLDNFYNRSHITPSSPKVLFLIIGGSDGSGTRTFVKTLMDLGVSMIVDYYDTMDVHGEEMMFMDHNKKHSYGWPPLVKTIMNVTHSANYSLQDLPRSVQKQAIEALLHLKSRLLEKGRDAHKTIPSLVPPAAGVQYGWKAPVSMLLLPLLQQVFGPIKFIHVVRDGRDVALSDNQSPLDKFYDTYCKDTDKDAVKSNRDRAMHLWNDWNYQVLQWEQHQQRHCQEQQRLADNDRKDLQHFDYLVTRTEDLIRSETRLQALVQLAEFVGARVSPEQLCCRSQTDLEDMGESEAHEDRAQDHHVMGDSEHGTTKDEVEKVIMARYGKWKKMLQKEPLKQKRLQDIGSESLRAFGYEPAVRFLDESREVQAYAKKRKTEKCAVETYISIPNSTVRQY